MTSKSKSITLKSHQEDDKTIHFHGYSGKNPLTFKDAFELLGKSKYLSSFTLLLTKTLQSIKFKHFFIEMPAVNSTLMTQQFEFVILDAPEFENKKADPSDFIEHMKKDKTVVSFENLRKDAMLIVPCPCETNSSGFLDLKSFLVNAKNSQIVEFWKEITKNLFFVVENHPYKKVWCSTSGLGVSWLHFRLDSKPKYYKYNDFKN